MRASEFERFERSGWARRSGSYDDGFGALCAGAHPHLLRAAGTARGARLLEVGCGTGRLTSLAVAAGAAVVATDPVPDMVTLAVSTSPGVPAACASLPDLPFPDGVFDAAVGAFVLNHVADPVASVAELRRVLRDGGRIALSIWDDDARNRALGVVSEAVAESAGSDQGPGGHSPMRAYGGQATLPGLLREAGLRGATARRAGWTHTVTAKGWWRAVLGGTVRTAARIERLDGDTVDRIRAAYHRNALPYRVGDHLELPASALIATGTR